jgi:hypothetical protein
VLEEAMTEIEGLPEEAVGQWTRVAWYFLLLVFHRREQGEYTELGQRLVERARGSKFRLTAEVEEMDKTMAQVVEERGRAAGRAEGEARGRAEGEARGRAEATRRMVLRVLRARFGELPEALVAQVEAAEPEWCEELAERAARAESLTEL